MSDNEDKEDKPTRAQLEVAFPGRTFMDGWVSEDQLVAAYPEVADGASISGNELKDLSAHKPRPALPLSKQLMILLSMGYDPESAVGRISLFGVPIPENPEVAIDITEYPCGSPSRTNRRGHNPRSRTGTTTSPGSPPQSLLST